MLGGPPAPQQPLYLNKSKDSTKRYIGRAAKVGDGHNPFETIWIERLDIGNAIMTLGLRDRIILGRRYLLGEDNDITGAFLGISGETVRKLRSRAIRIISNKLDGIPDEPR
jgi:DNA-directed RNA polymerase specialized sigma24 family protein